MVSITGSVRAGIEVAEAAAGGLKRLHLELGGKAPVIVFDDANAETAAAQIADAGYYNAGQDCTAVTRVLAAPGIEADLAGAFAERARGLMLKRLRDGRDVLGSVSTAAAGDVDQSSPCKVAQITGHVFGT